MAGERKSINPELWHACAGPRVSLPPVGSLVVYFPQGHLEQVAASTQKELDGQFPNYPNLPSQLICQLHNVVLHADIETDEVFAQMTLQPINAQGKEAFLSPPDLSLYNRQPNDFFCKTLTASDTSTHGGFSVPRRSANKVFPPLDYSKEPPAQELHAKDLHGQLWTFRHIFRGQPKRHLLTTGWSVFVSTKRLVAGDSVVFIRDEKEQLLIGIRRANRQQTAMPSSVLSTDSMHIGVLAAAAHAYTTSTRFLVFYNPRASPSEFVVPLVKYNKAIYGMQLSVGTRFRMAFETEELTLRRYMGTITGMSDLDPIRWPSSPWCNSEVGWDESSSGERPRRVSAWDIEPISTTPFHICPPQLMPLRPKRTWLYGSLGDEVDLDGTTKRGFTLLRGESSRREVEASPLQSLNPAIPLQSESHMRHIVTTASVASPDFMVDDDSDQHSQFRFPNPNPTLASLSTAYFPDLDDGDLAQISRNAFSLQNILSRPHKVDEMAWSHQNLPTLSSMQMPQPAHANSSAPTISTTTTSMIPFSIHPPEFQGYGGITDSSVVSSLVDPKSYGVGNDINAQMRNSISLPSLLPSPSQSFQSLPASISSSIASDASMNSGFSVSGGIDDALLPPIRTSGGWPSMPTPLRTFTKVQKFGSIGRSLDVSRFTNYVELRRELARLFNLQGHLDDPHSGWQLVFVDNEGDVLLIGDDPWEEFVSCVRIIRILSPSEVLQMSQEGMELLKATPSTTCDDEPHVWKDNTWGLAQ